MKRRSTMNIFTAVAVATSFITTFVTIKDSFVFVVAVAAAPQQYGIDTSDINDNKIEDGSTLAFIEHFVNDETYQKEPSNKKNYNNSNNDNNNMRGSSLTKEEIKSVDSSSTVPPPPPTTTTGQKGSASVLTTTEERNKRKHQLLRKRQRKTQQCNIGCFSEANCNNHANFYSNCNLFRQCINGVCGGPKCGQFCSNNSQCKDATDGCNLCDGQTCYSGSNRSGVLNTSGGGLCGTPCFNNPNICKGPNNGGCNICNQGYCTSNGLRTCGSPCNGFGSCSNALGGCIDCVNGICSTTNRSGVTTSCVSTEAELRLRMQGGGTIAICNGPPLQITSEVTSSLSDITLQCQGGSIGSCTILGTNGQTRLLRFNGERIKIIGIKFQNGRAIATGSSSAPYSGGSIYMAGGGNEIRNCQFIGSVASSQGGAAYSWSGTYSGNTFIGGGAAQCSQIYQQSNGFCFAN